MLQSYQEILQLQAAKGVFTPFDEKYAQGASYDLHIGTKVYIACSINGTKGVINLKENQSFIVPANGIFMFQTHEKIKLPDNVAGRLSLRMGLVRKGLIMPSQTQADPGYHNYLFGFLYNLSNEDITLKMADHVVSIELYKLIEPTQKIYKKDYSYMTFEEFISNYVTSSLDFLNQKISKSQLQLSRSTSYLKILSAIYTVVGIGIALAIAYLNFGPYSQLKEKYNDLQSRNNSIEDNYYKLNDKLNDLEKELIIFQSKDEGKPESKANPKPKAQSAK